MTYPIVPIIVFSNFFYLWVFPVIEFEKSLRIIVEFKYTQRTQKHTDNTIISKIKKLNYRSSSHTAKYSSTQLIILINATLDINMYQMYQTKTHDLHDLRLWLSYAIISELHRQLILFQKNTKKILLYLLLNLRLYIHYTSYIIAAQFDTELIIHI